MEAYQPNEATKQQNGVQCFVCRKFGHVKTQYWYKTKEQNVAIVAAKEPKQGDVQGLLFMESSGLKHKDEGAWLVDSGCSNHMVGERRLFESIEKVPP